MKKYLFIIIPGIIIAAGMVGTICLFSFNRSSAKTSQEPVEYKDSWAIETQEVRKYYDSEGKAVTGKTTIPGEEESETGDRYFDEEGRLCTGFFVDTKTSTIHYADQDGILQKGIVNVSADEEKERYMYFDENYNLFKGWFTYENDKYYATSSGDLIISKIQSLKNELYYFDKDGKLQTGGWIDVGEGKKAYASPDGQLLIDWQSIDGAVYYFEKGIMTTEWKYFKTDKEPEHWSYFGTDGKLVKNQTLKINNNDYTFDGKGWLTSEPVGLTVPK